MYIISTLFAVLIGFFTVGIFYTIKEESIRIEQLKKQPEKAIYKNINLEFKGKQNENL